MPFAFGDVFAAIGSGLVQHYTNAGVLLETQDTTNGGFTTGMAFDASGNLYVTNFSANKVDIFDSSGALINADALAGLTRISQTHLGGVSSGADEPGCGSICVALRQSGPGLIV